jgi:long-chain acyl-CoA synthetase
VADRSLARLAEQAFERHGDYDALWFEGTVHRSGELRSRVRRVAAGLTELGVARGDRVVVIGSNCPEIGISYNALWRAGAAITPAVFLLPATELRHILVDSEAVAAIVSPEFRSTVEEAGRGVETLRWILSTDDLPDAEEREAVPVEDSDLAALMYTGGTTGRAKGVMLSHANLWSAGKAAQDFGHEPGINRSLTPLPLAHAFGLIVTVVGLHSAEPGLGVLMRWFEPFTLLESIQEHRVQVCAVVPSAIQALLSLPLEDYDLSSLRYVVSGGAPLAVDVAEALQARLPHVRVREGYGLTETSAIVSSNPPAAIRLGSVGLPVPGCEVRIDEDGEILVRSPFVMQGYWRAPEQTAETIRDGWLHTGDIGRLDEDGYLYVIDRKKDLIIRGGFNVFPRDVEDALLEHPAVELAAVVGRPDERLGEEVVAFVSLRADASADDLREWSKARLGAHRYPREVRVVPSVPLTPVGKVDRKALRALVRLGEAPPSHGQRP